MNRCDEFNEMLAAEALGELEDTQKGRLNAHLAACEDCRGALAGLKAALGVLTETAPAPAGYFSTLPARVHARMERKARLRSRSLWGGAALAAMLLLAFGVLLRMQGGASAPPDEDILERRLAALSPEARAELLDEMDDSGDWAAETLAENPSLWAAHVSADNAFDGGDEDDLDSLTPEELRWLSEALNEEAGA